MGTQDSLEQAEEFVDRNATSTPLMVWDSGFDSWNHYDVSSQPTLVLVGADGSELGRWNSLNAEIDGLLG